MPTFLPTRGAISRRRFAAGLALGALATGGARAAQFPVRPVRIVVPWAAGGGGDVVVRMLGVRLADRLGQPIVVENRGGATGTIGSQAVATSAPDGYTFVYATSDSHSIFPNLNKQVPYDPRRDFTALAPIGYFQFGLAVRPTLPVRDVKEFLQLARTAPNPLTYATWGTGSNAHILMESFRARNGNIALTHVPYQGTAPQLMGLVAGQVDAAILPMQITDQYVKNGGIRMIGLGSPQRAVNLPDLPTLKEQGMDIDMRSWVGFLGPARLPADITAQLHDAISSVMAEPKVKENLTNLYVQAEIRPQAEYQAFVNAEYDRWARIVTDSKVVLG